MTNKNKQNSNTSRVSGEVSIQSSPPDSSPKRTARIYLYTFSDGKQYVGQTWQTLKKRHRDHLRDGLAVDDEIRKDPKKIPVEIAGGFTERSVVNEFERFYIKELNTREPYGWNIASGGSSLSTHSPKTTAIMGKKSKAKWQNPDYIGNSIAFRKQIGEGVRKRWEDPDYACNQPEWRELVGRNSKRLWAQPNSPLRSEECNKKRRKPYIERHKILVKEAGYKWDATKKLCADCKGYFKHNKFYKSAGKLFGVNSVCKRCFIEGVDVRRRKRKFNIN